MPNRILTKEKNFDRSVHHFLVIFERLLYPHIPLEGFFISRIYGLRTHTTHFAIV